MYAGQALHILSSHSLLLYTGTIFGIWTGLLLKIASHLGKFPFGEVSIGLTILEFQHSVLLGELLHLAGRSVDLVSL